jgi:hypothetical protein
MGNKRKERKGVGAYINAGLVHSRSFFCRLEYLGFEQSSEGWGKYATFWTPRLLAGRRRHGIALRGLVLDDLMVDTTITLHGR